jgi:hypothetical protein
LVLLGDLADHDRAVLAGVERDLARRTRERLANDLDAVLSGPGIRLSGIDESGRSKCRSINANK